MSLFAGSWLFFANRVVFDSFIGFIFNMIKSHSSTVSLSCFPNCCICEYSVIKRFFVPGRGGFKTGFATRFVAQAKAKGLVQESLAQVFPKDA
ncbi:hypothetical protein LP417_15110 [Polaromonas sp. P1-6]|nr:hypothetical protein LP417_15110 [Polaromonas sp. P1-6]